MAVCAVLGVVTHDLGGTYTSAGAGLDSAHFFPSGVCVSLYLSLSLCPATYPRSDPWLTEWAYADASNPIVVTDARDPTELFPGPGGSVRVAVGTARGTALWEAPCCGPEAITASAASAAVASGVAAPPALARAAAEKEKKGERGDKGAKGGAQTPAQAALSVFSPRGEGRVGESSTRESGWREVGLLAASDGSTDYYECPDFFPLPPSWADRFATSTSSSSSSSKGGKGGKGASLGVSGGGPSSQAWVHKWSAVGLAGDWWQVGAYDVERGKFLPHLVDDASPAPGSQQQQGPAPARMVDTNPHYYAAKTFFDPKGCPAPFLTSQAKGGGAPSKHAGVTGGIAGCGGYAKRKAPPSAPVASSSSSSIDGGGPYGGGSGGWSSSGRRVLWAWIHGPEGLASAGTAASLGSSPSRVSWGAGVSGWAAGLTGAASAHFGASLAGDATAAAAAAAAATTTTTMTTSSGVTVASLGRKWQSVLGVPRVVEAAPGGKHIVSYVPHFYHMCTFRNFFVGLVFTSSFQPVCAVAGI